MRYSLRHRDQAYPLGPRPFTIGRSDTCELTIDDDTLMSRRHATFVVRGELVTVEDLDSRNGVFVNGARVRGPSPLALGDRIVVGSQELLLAEGEQTSEVEEATEIVADDLAAATLASAPLPREVRARASDVDFVVIGGHEYAVLPKSEYLRLHALATTDGPAPTSKQPGKKRPR
jgi:pSer/pThr/pTyr-binding forkhead associated (FHA) protein